ncbi:MULTISPECIES: ABC transporter permease [Lysobacter]|uniref:ABC transporter permease n=1 Tax=Lysobacter soli TaxID=453783 RepID=A0A3D8VGY5_9GAMM|nr:FtsX-like permease family protein [Lysobacter soli]MDG2517218.1 FtsX-like permease family protein [Lysobacter soli]QGW63856.1 FtsX-like permease family protein [Lysobacter soli]RDY68672.1 ABC transporter permease [Lysobacter soli]UTA54347.1 FtsX-like permease family protein [Lysobacter soli]
MKYLHLIWAALFRSKTRTFLTLLSVVTAFLLFGMLDSVRVAFSSSANVAGTNRLITTSKLSITSSLPYRLQSQIESVPGVKKASYATWFGGIYQDPKNFFPNFAVGPGYMELYPEYVVPADQLKAFYATQDGAIVGEALATKHGWKIGDTIPLQATIFPTKGSNNWNFKLVAIYRVNDNKRKGEENTLMFNWKYFDEANDYIKGQVHWYVIDVANADQSNAVAQAIDKLSDNSDHETKTQTEAAFNQAFFKQIGDIGMIVTSIMGAVFFTLLLLTGNTMAQAVRERIPELAVLKTIGFSNRSVLWLVLAEATLLVVLGGLIGLGLAALIMPGVSSASRGLIQLPSVPGATWGLGLALMLIIGVVVGLLPALRAMRLNIVDALAGR